MAIKLKESEPHTFLVIPHPSGSYPRIKRAMDIFLAGLLLILSSPLFLLIAICIRLDSEGPIFFKQTRVSQNRRIHQRRMRASPRSGTDDQRKLRDRRLSDVGGRPFTMYKFRTMRHNCDSEVHRRYMEGYIQNQPAGTDCTGMPKESRFKLNGDRRVTRVGRILRKLSLDELPQFINVIKGDMSMIGPRPALPYEVLLYQEWHRRRLRVLPGITGWWQVKGRSRVSFDEAVQMDIYYAEHCCLLLDLEILLLTPWAILSCRGAR